MDYSVSVESPSDVDKQIVVQIPRENFNKRVSTQIRKTAAVVQLKGFRKGKAPTQIVEKLYGDQVKQEVIDEVFRDAYESAVKEHDLAVFGLSDFKIEGVEESGDLTLKASVAIVPKPEIKDYLGVSFEVEVEELTTEAVESEIKRLLESHAEVNPIEGREVAQDGDVCEVKFSATVDGEPFGGSERDPAFIIIGSGSWPKGLEDGIVGMKIDETKTVTAQFPDNYADAKVAGKEAQFTVTLKKLSSRKLPELNDDFAKHAGAESLEGLRTMITERLAGQIEERNKEAREDGVIKAIAERNEFGIPQLMVDEEIRQILFSYGLLDPEKRESYRVDVAPFRGTLSSTAEFKVRRGIIMRRIVEQENMDVTKEECDQWLDKRAEEVKLDRNSINRIYGYPNDLTRIKGIVITEKLMQRLLGEAKVSETKTKAEAA